MCAKPLEEIGNRLATCPGLSRALQARVRSSQKCFILIFFNQKEKMNKRMLNNDIVMLLYMNVHRRNKESSLDFINLRSSVGLRQNFKNFFMEEGSHQGVQH